MSNEDLLNQALIAVTVFAAMFVFVRYGWPQFRIVLAKQERRYDRVLNRQLLMNIRPKLALGIVGAGVVMVGLVCAAIGEDLFWFVIGAGAALVLPTIVINHLETKRRQRLEEQLVDGVVALSSGVRAGLNLVQSMQLMVRNANGPIRQEFEHLLREYDLGIDLHQAMLNASERIGSSHYRLLFTAIQAHRERGGNVAESLDRITDSVREIQRLEGKLQTLTAQGRNQAWMMAGMALVVLAIAYMIAPDETAAVVGDPFGRVVLLAAAGLITAGFLWIRNIMRVDI